MFNDLHNEDILIEEALNEIVEETRYDLNKVDLVHLHNYFANRMSDDIDKKITQNTEELIAPPTISKDDEIKELLYLLKESREQLETYKKQTEAAKAQKHSLTNHFSFFLDERYIELMNNEDKENMLIILANECRQLVSLLAEARDEIGILYMQLETYNKQYMLLLERLANLQAMQPPAPTIYIKYTGTNADEQQNMMPWTTSYPTGIVSNATEPISYTVQINNELRKY